MVALEGLAFHQEAAFLQVERSNWLILAAIHSPIW